MKLMYVDFFRWQDGLVHLHREFNGRDPSLSRGSVVTRKHVKLLRVEYGKNILYF